MLRRPWIRTPVQPLVKTMPDSPSPSPVSRCLSTSLLALLALLACNRTYPVPQPASGTQSEAAAPRCLPAAGPMAMAQPGGIEQGNMPSSACLERARQLVARLSLREKLGQMMQPDRGRIRHLAEITKNGYGSVLSGGGSAPDGNQLLDWSNMVDDYRKASLDAVSGIPLMYAVDAVHGHNNVHGAVIFPHNIGLGATRDPELVERIGRATAREVRATRIDWTFAPVVAFARDERWGRTYEAFGETAELAELLGPALVRGLQGDDLAHPESVLATAKHFVGDGHTQGGVDQGNASLDPDQVEELLTAYEKTIAAGVGSIMVSFSSIDQVKMHCHGPLLNDTLKSKMGFGGFLVSDWEAVEQLPGSYPEQLSAAINAGLDMIMAPKVHDGFLSTMAELVPTSIPLARIDDAVTRILAIKCMLGMFDEERYALGRDGRTPAAQELVEAFGGAEHRTLAREAAARSLVLLKNERSALPLPPAPASLYVTGTGADDLGRQCGGWTISWQGDNGPITRGTTVLQALRHRYPHARIQHSKRFDAKLAALADVALVVSSERPYAEMKGDDPDLDLDVHDREAVDALHSARKPIVFVLLSGRPLVLAPVIDKVDAVVAAWLPGSEGAGVVDVLSGDQSFTGLLPHSWPRSIEQVPINVGDAAYDPLFPYGFGLRYETPQPHPPNVEASL